MSELDGNSRRRSDQRAWLVVVGILLPVQSLLLAWIACRYSATADEVAHLAAGVRILSTGDFSLYTVNPPISKIVACLPVMLENPRVSWKQMDPNPGVRREWNVGQDLMWANRTRSLWFYTLARWASIPWTWPGLIVTFLWARERYGNRSGLAAATLWVFSPAILGNGALITPDIAATSMTVFILYVYRRYLLAPDWRGTLLSGFCLGIGELTKMTLLVLYPILLLLTVTTEWWKPPGERAWLRRAGEYAVCVLVSVFLLNAAYLFHGTGRTLGERAFFSESLGGPREDWSSPGNRFQGTWLGRVPVPLPTDYLNGFDLQRRDFEGHWRPLHSYMEGRLQFEGWWYYYLYCLLVKVPVGSWVVAVAGIASGVMTPSSSAGKRFERLMLWTTPALLFVFVSSQTGFSRCYRYILPCAPFVMIGVSRVFSTAFPSKPRFLLPLATTGLTAMVASSLWVYPHSLAFFNLPAGGPANGHWRLLDSNFDWGQDLYCLRDWANLHPHRRPLFVACAGVLDPRVLGIEASWPPEQHDGQPPHLAPGWYAVSANHIHGYDSAGGPLTYFLDRQPIDRAGYTIFIYEVPETEP